LHGLARDHRTRRSASSRSLASFSLHAPTHHRALPSFPTRRSSDLTICSTHACRTTREPDAPSAFRPPWSAHAIRRKAHQARASRSEEHTSELQSRGQLVCRLLLEKKSICQAGPLDTVADRAAIIVV